MAIVKGPALSISASGNLGAICYSTWRGMQIAKDAWTGTVPNTTKQVAQQALLTAVSQAWGDTLTADQRGTWYRRAKTVIWKNRLGSPYIPSGYQLFMKWNIRRRVMGLAIMTIAPVEQEWVYVGFLNNVIHFAGGYIAIKLVQDFGIGVLSYGVEYYKAGPYNSGGRRPIDGEWLYLDREVPPLGFNDYGVVALKWYWYRGRAISKFGDVQNWCEIQVQFV